MSTDAVTEIVADDAVVEVVGDVVVVLEAVVVSMETDSWYVTPVAVVLPVLTLVADTEDVVVVVVVVVEHIEIAAVVVSVAASDGPNNVGCFSFKIFCLVFRIFRRRKACFIDDLLCTPKNINGISEKETKETHK
jgi:hypothetical protein